MDASAVNVNVTVDDFDSVLSYADQSVWQTPDPSSPSFSANGSPWLMGTYHQTDALNASFAFNFTGPAIYIYGYSGPSHGSYEVQIDSSSSTLSAYSSSNASTPHLLYSANSLTYGPHKLAIRNLGKLGADAGGNTLLFDFLQTTVQMAPAGATISNKTIEETDSTLKYSGKWGNNSSPNFSGGGTTFTNQDGAAVSLSFRGSAVYVFGDKKNDHGLYSVVLDNGTSEIFNGISGCGGAFAMTCEQMKPTLAYFASNLDDSSHTLRIQNIGGVNNSFFDLDSIVFTVPSAYAPRQLSNPSTASPSSSAASSSPSAHPNGAISISELSSVSNSLILLIFAMFWVLRPSLKR